MGLLSELQCYISTILQFEKKKKKLQTVRWELTISTPCKEIEKERDLQPQRIKVKNDTYLTNREYLKQ